MSPILPLHIIRAIFEHTARYNIQAATRLVQVSHLVQHWTDPILYANVVLLRERSRKAFLRTARSSKRALLSATVHSLCLSFDPKDDCVPNILLACPRIVDITIYTVQSKSLNEVELQIASWNFEKLLGALNRLRPRQVQIQLGALSTAHARISQFRHYFFLSTTHLMIMDSWEYWGWFDFAMLPSLTHLSLNLRIHSLPLESIKHALEFIRDVLGRCTRLRLCIVRISSLGPLEVSEESVQSIHPLIRDQRLVFLYDTEHLFRSQGVEMTRDTSIWEQAGDIYNERDKANTNPKFMPSAV
ncbi:uncharacterized protein C8R40DRAFT_1127626 [Lentinula edodes]|uniref:uncharacterized protein n=1 Tax=Lentinula edodes TaxID=5353 RepID=UPI001E8D5F85|nr:uncharacterized protein C8R40DRAFT_1127626 [Lentinula edodes]KAH7870202.1 hypothetical protein C8R40DRAFT_1127626 [Lentinula edodes]